MNKMTMLVAATLPLAACALQTGDTLSGFTVKGITDLPEIKARLVRMEYAKNGADLVWLDRADDNMTFAIGFRTLPADDTGVAHIMEHSVLCGSDKYPVKEPFVDLLKSSFATFLNAYTSSDMTMYPVATRNRADLLNLIDVYMDAVLHPLSVQNPLAFRQEGWHYELKDGKLTRNGIVYSEMQGAFANPERALSREVRRLLHPQSTYGFVSGGDPAAIPQLTFAAYQAFYRRFYHPSNARIFLDGRVDLPTVLAKLDGFLAPYGRRAVEPLVFQKPVSAQKEVEYEIGADDSPDGKILLADGWVFGTYAEHEKLLAADILADALAGSNEAPLTKALLDAGLCEDVSFGVWCQAHLEANLTLKNVKRAHVARARQVVRDTLARLAEKGLDHARLEALVNRAEFRNREKESGDTPLGLALLGETMDFWLYGGDPADAFRNDARFASLRKKIAAGEFEKLLKEIFLDNPHHAQVTFVPNPKLGARRRAAREAELAQILASWSPEEKARIEAECRALQTYQSTPDRAEDTAKLPILAVKDVPAVGPETACAVERAEGVTVLRPHLPANGVAHIRLYFAMDDLTDAELADTPMLAEVLGELATAHHSAEGLRNAVEGSLGCFSTSTAVGAQPVDPAAPRARFCVHVAALDAKRDEIARLLPEVLLTTKFDDADAIGNLLKQRRMGLERSTMGLGGRVYPFRRACAQLTARGAAEETLSGFAQIRHLQAADAAYAQNGAAYRARLAALARKIFIRSRLTICLADNEPLAFAGVCARLFPEGRMGVPCVRKPFPRVNEGFRIPAGIGFAARAAHPAKSVRTGQSLVAARILSLNYLWNEIRVKGGAYGGNIRVAANGDAGWLSWNDPQPGRSLGVYAKSGDALRAFAASAEPIDRFIVSTVAATEPYRSPSAEAAQAAEDWFAGRTTEVRRRERAEMLATTKRDLAAFAATADELARTATICVLGGEQPLAGCKETLKTVENVVRQGAKK